MKKYRYILPLLLCVLIHIMVSGQERPQHGPPNVAFFETVTLPSDEGNLIRLDVNYRVMKIFFILTRTSSTSSDYEYQGGMELSIELFDTKGQSRSRKITQQNIYSDTPIQEFPDVGYVEGSLSFELPPGEYRFLIHMQDQNSQRRYVDRDRRIIIPEYTKTKPAVYDIVFIDPVMGDDVESILSPVNFGGNILFGNEVNAVMSFSSSPEEDAPPGITITVHRLTKGDRSYDEIFSKTVPEENIRAGTKLRGEHSENTLQYHIIETGRTDLQTAILPMNGKTLEEGEYRITITKKYDGETSEKTKTFRVVWIDKPASLRNLDFAVEMLEYVMSREEYRELRRGSSDERRRKFFEYWQEKDPEPQTAYNPVMTEFYRRVDYAAREFTTIRERNGARTDRGKIYIIYGPPTNIYRELTPGQAPQETWEYRHLNQKFIFVDQTRQGNYRLIIREDL